MPTRPHLGDRSSVARAAPIRLQCRPGDAIRAWAATSTSITPPRAIEPLDPAVLATLPDAPRRSPTSAPIAPFPHALDVVIAKAASQQSHPVRRHAVLASLVPTRAAPYTGKQLVEIKQRALAIEGTTKSKGRADGAVHRSGLATLDALIHFARCGSTGRCDPSIAALAKHSRQNKSTLVDAIKRFEALGLITATRRWFKAFCKSAGQVVSRQITTSYTLCVEHIARIPIPDPRPGIFRRVIRTAVDAYLQDRRALRSGIRQLAATFRAMSGPFTHTGPVEDILSTPLFQEAAAGPAPLPD